MHCLRLTASLITAMELPGSSRISASCTSCALCSSTVCWTAAIIADCSIRCKALCCLSPSKTFLSHKLPDDSAVLVSQLVMASSRACTMFLRIGRRQHVRLEYVTWENWLSGRHQHRPDTWECITIRPHAFRSSAVAAAGPDAGSQAPDAVDASGIGTPHVSFRHAITPAPDAQAGPAVSPPGPGSPPAPPSPQDLCAALRRRPVHPPART